MVIAYWIVSLMLLSASSYFLLLFVWRISKNNGGFYFTNMFEGTGTFIMNGNKAGKIIIAKQGFRCELVEETRRMFNNDGQVLTAVKVTREKIIEGTPRYSPGILGWLEQKYGIYWVGLPPNRRMNKMFKWSEWKEKVTSGNDKQPNDGIADESPFCHREEMTNFFSLQNFPYALVLKGAETGGVPKEAGGAEVGGNLSVDIEIDLFLQIVYPRVALFGNEDWYVQLGSVVLDHARMYVGKHPYEKLRSQKEAPQGQEAYNEFSEYIMELNKYASIGENYESIVDALGVKIIGAQIRTVSLSKNSANLIDATTKAYVAQQDYEVAKLTADGEAYGIIAVATAKRDALVMQINAVKDGQKVGELVLNSQTLSEMGRSGNTFVTNGNTPFILNTGKKGGENAGI